MTHRWEQTIQIDEKLARELIETQNQIQVSSIQLLDQGWDNLVYLVNNELIFRFPRREFGVYCMENEILILPQIAKQVSFPLSCPQWIGAPGEAYPYAYGGYPMLPGKPLSEAADELVDNLEFAKTLAKWLKQLHALKVSPDSAALIKGDQSWRLNVPHRIARCHEYLEQYENYFAQAGIEKKALLAIVEKLALSQFQDLKKSYLHGDLYCRHVMVDENTLLPTGLIDWGDVHVGHPGIDLAVGYIFTKPALDAFLAAYGELDEETRRIMAFHSFCHSLSFLPYAFEQDKSTLKHWSTLVLRRGVEELKVLSF